MNKYCFSFLLSIVPSFGVFAQCGDMPTPPQELQLPQLSTEQLAAIKSELDSFSVAIQEYRDCVDQLIVNIAPADAPIEYFDSPEYQNTFDSYQQLDKTATEREELAIERFNYLLEHAAVPPAPQPTEN